MKLISEFIYIRKKKKFDLREETKEFYNFNILK